MNIRNLEIEVTSSDEVIITEKNMPNVFAEVFGDTIQDKKTNAKAIMDSFQFLIEYIDAMGDKTKLNIHEKALLRSAEEIIQLK